MILKHLQNFWEYYASNTDIEIYNEFSLQHELGIYLRNNMPEYKVQFERNVKYFLNDNAIKTRKHEIDIVVFNEQERYAIELKYPRHGQYPVRMFQFIKDIQFMEELKANGFNRTFTMVIVDEIDGKNYYSGSLTSGIYNFFRSDGSNMIHGKIEYPCSGKIVEALNIIGSYQIKWWMLPKKLRGYLLEINFN